jgi:hypothetical protein
MTKSNIAPSEGLELTSEQLEGLKDWEMQRSFTSAKLAEKGIPAYMRDGLMRHILLGETVGGFLTALLSGDPWHEVFQKADETNRSSMLSYLHFLYNDVPRDCWRSERDVKHWKSIGGYTRICGLDRELVRLAITTGKVTWP